MTNYPWSNFTPAREDAHTEWEGAMRDMEAKRYVQAAGRLEWILEQPVDHRHGLGDVRETLARAYFHSARLEKAEQLARAILTDRPNDGYMAMLLARALERQGRVEDAKAPRALARALGVEA